MRLCVSCIGAGSCEENRGLLEKFVTTMIISLLLPFDVLSCFITCLLSNFYSQYFFDRHMTCACYSKFWL